MGVSDWNGEKRKFGVGRQIAGFGRNFPDGGDTFLPEAVSMAEFPAGHSSFYFGA